MMEDADLEAERVMLVIVKIPYFGKKGVGSKLAKRLATVVKLKFGKNATVVTKSGRTIEPED